MKNKRRKCLCGIINHCYQNTQNGYLLFYDDLDYLVYFTIVCTVSRKHDIRIVGLSLMPDHVHSSNVVNNKKELSACIQEATCLYAFLNNTECNRRGSLFRHRFGSAPKIGDKAARTNIIYLGNNPVERHLCEKAEEYKWGFIPYAISPNPFSAPIVIKEASKALKYAIRCVKNQFNLNKPLSYPLLRRLYRPLDEKENLQLTDFIISLFNVIDYDYTISFFGSYDNMLHAMHCTTGKEYDLNEVFVGKTDKKYAEVTTYLKNSLHVSDIHHVLALPEDRRTELFFDVLKNVDIPAVQLAKYLRLIIKRNS